MEKRKVVLLDLNKTLAEECAYDFKTFKYNVSKDVYSTRLVDVLKKQGHEVHLLTARTQEYKVITLAKIYNDTGFTPDFAVFKTQKYQKVHDFKRNYAETLIKSGVLADDIIAVESNINTHREYRTLGITNIYKRDKFLAEFDV